MTKYGLWIHGKESFSSEKKLEPVINPYNDQVIAEVSMATLEDLESAISSAQRVFTETMSQMPAYQRANILKKASELLREQAEEFVQVMCLEAGKPISDCRNEVKRVIEFLEMCGEGAKRIKGEVLAMDSSPAGKDRFGFTVRVPIGVIAAIGPFNAPLNLVVQKVAPAIAAGNTVVLKPATKTPITSLKLAVLMKEAGLPDGALNVITGSGSVIGDALVSDQRVRMVTFTGGVQAGKRIHEKAGLKKTVLELGSNAPNIVFADADLDYAVNSLSRGGFAAAGQACIAAQRLFVQRDIFEPFVARLVQAVEKMPIGDPRDEATLVGPMIHPSELDRVVGWIEEAKAQGAVVLTGGKRIGNTLLPTLITKTTSEMKVYCMELFAPVCTVTPFETKEEVVGLANDSQFGLQAGVFTKDLQTAFYVAKHIEVGGIWINESSRVRQDNYPFGGLKDSGIGREGLDYTIEDMTEVKFVGFKLS